MASGGQRAGRAARSKLECAICLERYRRPKLLPCFHTFCQACLQTVAGTSPSFPCPACRNPVIVPRPGGVGALQTNFYIEEDLDNEPTHTKLCEVCDEQREATHKCLQCKQKYCGPCRRCHDAFTSLRSHAVISVQTNTGDPEYLRGKTVAHGVEEKCLKHPQHELILYCTSCKTIICIQCKLTLHEGHPAEHLADAGVKVKARVQDKLERMKEKKAVLDSVLATTELECMRLQEVRKKTEKRMRNRGKILVQWVSQAVDTAVGSVRSVTEAQESRVRAHTQHVQDQRAAVMALCDHVTRVLDSDVDADIVSLEAQMTEVTVDRKEMSQLQEIVKKEASGFMCKHNPSAVNPADVLAFVGVLKKGSQSSHDQSVDASTSGTNATAAYSGVLATTVPKTVSNVQRAPRVIGYSTDMKSEVLAICPTSQNRLWIQYTSVQGVIMALYNEHGQDLERRRNVRMSSRLMTILGNVTISDHDSDFNKLVWIQPGGGGGEIDVKERVDIRPCCKSAHDGGHMVKLMQHTEGKRGVSSLGHRLVSFVSLQPFKWMGKVSVGRISGRVFDASANRVYIAAVSIPACTSVDVYKVVDSISIYDSTYTPGKGLRPRDACFCLIDGREMLLVAVDDNTVHVLDHTDGCRFDHYLDTGPLTLDNPRYLATDYHHRVWIVREDGKVVLVYL